MRRYSAVMPMLITPIHTNALSDGSAEYVKKMACVTAPPALPPAPTKPDTRPVERLLTNGTTWGRGRSGRGWWWGSQGPSLRC